MVIGIDGNEANIQNRVGSGQYALQLLHQFSKEKLENFVIYLKKNPITDLPKETENFKYKVFGPSKFWTQFALPLRLSFSKKPDVFFSMAHYGPRFSRVPYVVTIHDLSYLHFPQLFNKNDLIQLKSWSKYSIINSDHIIAPSKSTKKDIVKSYNVPESKITVTYEGIESKIFKPQPVDKISKAKSKYKTGENYIIFVGTLQPRKNLERLIEAFARLQGKNLNLVICGKLGWLYDSILQKSKDLGIEKKVVFTNYVPLNDLPALLSGAEIYVNLSLWEGFGIPVIEAQACGVPAVVSNTSSLPEIVGKSALLVDPKNTQAIVKSIKMLLDSKEERERLIKAGKNNTKRFSWSNCAHETLTILKQVASK